MMWVQVELIGHFLIPMTDMEGSSAQRTLYQPLRARVKIHRIFPYPPVWTGDGNTTSFTNGKNSYHRCNRQRCENCGSLSGTPLCSVRLWDSFIRAAILWFLVVVLGASICIIRHHSPNVLATRIIRSLSTVRTQKPLSWKKACVISTGCVSRKYSLFLSPLTSPFPRDSILFCLSEAEINTARLRLREVNMGAWLEIVAYIPSNWICWSSAICCWLPFWYARIPFKTFEAGRWGTASSALCLPISLLLRFPLTYSLALFPFFFNLKLLSRRFVRISKWLSFYIFPHWIGGLVKSGIRADFPPSRGITRTLLRWAPTRSRFLYPGALTSCGWMLGFIRIARTVSKDGEGSRCVNIDLDCVFYK